jgi:hypothetical protein
MRLIDRLKPEYSSKLEMNNITYPALVVRVCKELENIFSRRYESMALGQI